MSGDPTPYLDLVTSEHSDQPNFMTMVQAVLQPIVDNLQTIEGLPEDFDLDVAIGAQLDVVGQWVGRSRFLPIPLTGVYFAFDTASVGWDQGYWQGPFDPTSGVVVLADAPYRTLLRAVIQANQWDGTIPGAYNAWNTLFGATSFTIMIEDLQDMTMNYGILGPAPDAITLALFTGGFLNLKPAGVLVNFIEPSVPSSPFFGFDVEDSAISGWDVGSWATTLGST